MLWECIRNGVCEISVKIEWVVARIQKSSDRLRSSYRKLPVYLLLSWFFLYLFMCAVVSLQRSTGSMYKYMKEVERANNWKVFKNIAISWGVGLGERIHSWIIFSINLLAKSNNLRSIIILLIQISSPILIITVLPVNHCNYSITFLFFSSRLNTDYKLSMCNMIFSCNVREKPFSLFSFWTQYGFS